MAITIEWSTKIISVPKADLTLIQATPTEIRELNINWFHLQLRSLEASEGGMTNPSTHNHNTEVSLGGLTYARVVEIINGYTITFEDDQYAVNLVGANSNIGDVINVNQVSVRSQNSAGLISSPAIEFSSFEGGVTIDVTSSYSGTLFPTGTPQQPVNNLDDAKTIANYRGLSKLYVIGDIVFQPGDNIDGFIIVGQNAIKSNFTLSSGISSIGCEFSEATITGVLSGNAFIRGCTIMDLTYVEGQLRECVLVGTIVLSGGATTNILDCWDGIAGDGKPIVDMGGSGQSLTMGGYSGEIMLTNKNGSDKVSIDLMSGEVEVDSTVTNGQIFIRGVGTLIDNSTGTADINWSALLSREVYDDTIYVDTVNGSAGVQYPFGTMRYPSSNLDDAKRIADRLGIRFICMVGNATLTQSFSGYRIKAPHLSAGSLALNGQDVSGSVFAGMMLTGNATGPFSGDNCEILGGMTNIQATLENCVLSGTYTVAAGQSLQLDHCNLKGVSNSFDLNGSGNLSFAGISGVFTALNMTSSASAIAVTGNFICTLMPTITAGTVLASGNGKLNDYSGVGANVINTVTPGSVWDEPAIDHTDVGSYGSLLSAMSENVELVKKVESGRWAIVSNQMIFYDEDGTTPLLTFNLKDQSGSATMTNVFERSPA